MGIVAIYIAIILSAIMSTIDSLLVMASSAVVRDCYQQIFNPKLEKFENEQYFTLGYLIHGALRLMCSDLCSRNKS